MNAHASSFRMSTKSFLTLSLLFCLILITKNTFAQTTEKTMYVVDSIPLVDDPEYDDELLQEDIADLRVITNKDSLRTAGYADFDKVIYLFTKAYRSRPDSLKRIPTTSSMEKIAGRWNLHEKPYTGPFIDYYNNGSKKGEGYFNDGLLSGSRLLYHPGGKLSQNYSYKAGITDGPANRYYADGSLLHKGKFEHGKEHGEWLMYYPNGQIKQSVNFEQGVPIGEVRIYNSNGRLFTTEQMKNGKPLSEKRLEKLNVTMQNGDEAIDNPKLAIKHYSKAIELDSTYAYAFFSRGTAKLNNFQFEESIADFDKALALEPYLGVAYANRAFARIRKYQFQNTRTLSKTKEVTVLASRDSVSAPKEEAELICKDLKMAIFLGDENEQVISALKANCFSK